MPASTEMVMQRMQERKKLQAELATKERHLQEVYDKLMIMEVQLDQAYVFMRFALRAMNRVNRILKESGNTELSDFLLNVVLTIDNAMEVQQNEEGF